MTDQPRSHRRLFLAAALALALVAAAHPAPAQGVSAVTFTGGFNNPNMNGTSFTLGYAFTVNSPTVVGALG